MHKHDSVFGHVRYINILTWLRGFRVKNEIFFFKALANEDTLLRTHWVLSIMPKIPEISVGIQMGRFVSVSSERNIWDHLWRWSTYFDRNIPTEIRRSIYDKPVLCPN